MTAAYELVKKKELTLAAAAYIYIWYSKDNTLHAHVYGTLMQIHH